MKAEIIAVGSEMLTPDRLDTNSLFLTRQLNQLGIEVRRKGIVADDQEDVADAFAQAIARADLVISTGGLGPTQDDLTREAIAQLLGRKLLRNESVLQAMEARFRRMGRVMPEVNLRQAMVPEGADVLENSRGTAPGLWLDLIGRVVVLLPGPPHELKAIFAEQVAPRLRSMAGDIKLFEREVRTTGLTESEVEQRIVSIYTAYTEVKTTILTAPGEIHIHLRVWSKNASSAEIVLNEMVARINMVLGEIVFTESAQTLEQIIARDLTINNATLAVAESCTGGLVAERLTRVPGSSSYFRGGVVCYSNDLKNAWADVPVALIESNGAVSVEVARALAEGIRRRTGATLGIGITGIAGPGGGSLEKPVGLVHIALAAPDATTDSSRTFPGDRERIRWQASQAALDMIRLYFLYAQKLAPAARGRQD